MKAERKLDVAIQGDLRISIEVFAVLIFGAFSLIGSDIKSDLEGFQQNVKPLLKMYCVGCHGPEIQKGDIRLDTIDPDVVMGRSFDQWEDVREAFNTGEMPPKKKAQPSGAERDLMARWMDEEFKKAKLHGSTKKRGAVRRLTRYELQYALEDLLQFPVQKEMNMLP